MARRRESQAASFVGPVRDFTSDELARIRELTARQPAWSENRQVTDELHAIHQAAGRRRGFMLWDWDGTGPVFDPERAYAEEVSGGLQSPGPVAVRPSWWPAGM